MKKNMVQKNIQRKTSAVFLCGVFSVVFVLSTCLNPVGGSEPELPPEGGPNVLTVYIGGQSGSRTAMPDTSPPISGYSVTVRRGTSVLGSDSGTTPVTVRILDAPRAGDIVSVDGFYGGVKVVSGTAVVATDGVASISVPILYPANEGKGNINLTINLPSDVVSAEVFYYQGLNDYHAGKVSYSDYYGDPVAGTPLPSVPLNKNDIPAGDYVVKIEFFSKTGVKIKTLIQTALVRNGHTTSKWDGGGSPLTLLATDFASSDATLTDIGITGGPAFTFVPATYSYAISEALPGGAIFRTLNISKKDGQKIETTLNGTALAGSSLSLKKGDNSIVITVTAQDGVTSKTYTIGYTFFYDTTMWIVDGTTGSEALHQFATIDAAITYSGVGIRDTYASSWPGKGDGQPVPAHILIKADLSESVIISDTGLYTTLPPIHLEGDATPQNITSAPLNRPLFISNAHVILGDNLTLRNGYASGGDGGGVLIGPNSRFTMNGGTISGNTATLGGGGVSVSTDGSFTMNGGTIKSNTASGSSSGGGVYVSNGGNFTMNGGTIGGAGGPPDQNSSNTSGGVYVAGGTFNMNGGTISGNQASTRGGGVGITSGDFTMSGGAVINRNRAGIGGGGGVYVDGTGSSFAMSGGAAISGNQATGTSGGGGGVYFSGSAFNMTGGTISGNQVTGTSGGGGVYFSGSAFNMTGGTISGNQAGSSGGGGGVYFRGSAFNMTGGTISGNRASERGGGVLINSGGTFNMSGTVSGNTSNGDGGGVAADVANINFTMNGATISGNTATGTSNGGGVYFSSSSGTFTMLGGVAISGNTANGGDGGGVHIDTGSFTMSGGTTISGNRANNKGGGVAFSGTTFNMSGTISGNTANGDAGGVLVDISTGIFNMNGGSISGNSTTSTGSGGGVCLETGTFNMNGGSVSGNICDRGGGGMYCNNGIFNMYGGTISGNEARSQGGGGVKIQFAGFTMSNGSISGNKANDTDGNGGGVSVHGPGNFTMSGGSISGNTSVGNKGDGVYVGTDSGSTFTMSGNARVDTGNGVYLYSGRTITLSGALNANPAANIEGAISTGTQLLEDSITDGDPPNYERFLVLDEPYKIGNNGKYLGP